MDLSPIRRRWATLLALAATALIGVADYTTGPELGFSLFYLIPITACAWWLGRAAGVMTAVAAAVSWFLADFLHRGDLYLAISLWNGVARLGIFLALSLLTSNQRRDRAALSAMNLKLQELLEAEARLARTDALTGLPNSRAFMERLSAELARIRRTSHPFWLAYLDLDNFKQINDRFGHTIGDRVLTEIAGLIRKFIRTSDVPARLAGDEFAILFLDVQSHAPERMADRLLRGIRKLSERYPGCDFGASIGMIRFQEPSADPDQALRAVDRLMYEAKARGKGRLTTEDSHFDSQETVLKAV